MTTPPEPPELSAGQPQPASYRPQPPTAKTATWALVCGIGSFVCCGILGPVAIYLGRKAQQEIAASGGALGGEGLAQAGKILGIVATILWSLLIIFWIATGFIATILETVS